jgi:hypothetical protein
MVWIDSNTAATWPSLALEAWSDSYTTLAESRDDTLLDFLQATYEGVANLAKRDRNALERRA